MLKSHLNIQHDGVEEEEVPKLEEEESPHVSIEEPIEVPYRRLNKSEVCVRLSFLGKVAEGDGYAYLKATLTNLDLTTIDIIKCFKHLQFIDLSMNSLHLNELQAVTELPYLVLLQADKNKLNSAALNKMKYLQVLILNENDISTVSDIFQPELSTLELALNKIQNLKFESKMPNMRCLDFRNNSIRDIAGLDFPKLDSLYLANNKITSLAGLESLVNLRILHVRNNPLRLLDGFHENHTKLIYVNVRNCRVTTLRQIKKLRVLKGLETLIVKGCPYVGGIGEEDNEAADAEEDPEIRIEVLATLPRLKRLNKGVVTPEERDEAKALMLQWAEDGEKDEEELEDELHGEEEENIDNL